ncbi:hydroxymethylbilane synthase [Buchnera aphidicola]|uniref:hydroxymethylbilane synthase n=1 Tax=Buchnera aphidicola TaxID=9 RepID=UPI0034644D28
MKQKIIRIATRKSPLALLQSYHVKKKILYFYPHLKIQIIPINTYGDQNIDKPLYRINGKNIFIKELELALLKNQADIAIHSMKDIPIKIHNQLHLISICKRGNPLDALVSNYYNSINELPIGAIIGTSSLRRKCQLISYRPDLIIYPIRGNIETRINKLDLGMYDAIILGVEGLNKLKLKHRIKQIISEKLSLPSCGQGAIGIESRKYDKNISIILKKINNTSSYISIKAERSFCEILQSGCQTPIGSFAIIKRNILWLRGMIGSSDGKVILKGEQYGSLSNAKKIGYKLAKKLLTYGAKEILNIHDKKYN